MSGYNLTDLVIDKEGDTWMSSFKYGLLLKFKDSWEKINNIELDEDEAITTMETNKGINVLGTNKGKVILEDAASMKIIRKFILPFSAGPVEYMNSIDPSRIIISTRFSVFILKDDFKNLTNVANGFTLKCALLADTSIILAASSGLYKLDNSPDKKGIDSYLLKPIIDKRCLSLAYNKKDDILFAAFKDGLFEVKNAELFPIFYKGSQVHSINLAGVGDKIIIATPNQGLLKADRTGISVIHGDGEWTTRPVFHLKIIQDQLWVLGPEFLEAIDLLAQGGQQKIITPPLPDADIYGVGFFHNRVTILTSKGLYALNAINTSVDYKVKNYLMKVAVNGRDTTLANNCELPFNKNNIEIYLSSPFYINQGKINFKYRLLGAEDTTWKLGANSEKIFRYASLRPGKYQFEAMAFHPQFGYSEKKISVSFKILPPWNETIWFKTLLILLISFTTYWFMRGFYKERLEQQKITFERKLAIHDERQRISAAIHDDIGAGLSGVRLLTELIGEKTENPETRSNISRIYSSVSDLTAKMRELVWGLNVRNDSMEKLLHYIREQGNQLFENSPIQLIVYIPPEIPLVEFTGEQRTNIYLSVKEALHNALKHSNAEKVTLDFTIEKKFLLIGVKDNGNGLKGGIFKTDGNGMVNMKKRIGQLRGTMDIRNRDGVAILFRIPITYKV
jgi:signal transduction histidine kinase